MTFTDRNEILGRSLFDVFPEDPERPLADGVINLYTSLKAVANTGKPHAMAVQRYDIRNAAGDFDERIGSRSISRSTTNIDDWFISCITSRM